MFAATFERAHRDHGIEAEEAGFDDMVGVNDQEGAIGHSPDTLAAREAGGVTQEELVRIRKDAMYEQYQARRSLQRIANVSRS